MINGRVKDNRRQQRPAKDMKHSEKDKPHSKSTIWSYNYNNGIIMSMRLEYYNSNLFLSFIVPSLHGLIKIFTLWENYYPSHNLDCIYILSFIVKLYNSDDTVYGHTFM